MKFRDKDGYVFEDIESAFVSFDCSDFSCRGCPLGTYRCNEQWIETHPVEAARLMGYEVVEEYSFTIRLVDNDVDKDYERFEVPALEKLKDLCVGKVGFVSQGCTAKIVATELVLDETKKTLAGDTYCWIKATATIPETDENASLIREIESGIKKDISIGCSCEKRICSVCGKERCCHIPGELYNGQLCYYSLQNPQEVYEWAFVQQPSKKKEEANMDKQKPIADWTLGEVKDYCDERTKKLGHSSSTCETCPMNRFCTIDIGEWDLTDKPRFTEEEVADARAIVRIFGEIGIIAKGAMGGTFLLTDTKQINVNDRFPSIQPGQSVRLKEIVGDEE